MWEDTSEAKCCISPPPSVSSIRSTLESHLELKNLPPLQGLDALPGDINLAKGAEVWRMAVAFKRG